MGQRLEVQCLAATVRDQVGPLFGTGVYPSDSPICPAAVHAGVIDQGGGLVTVQLNPGAASYAGSLRHRLSSKDRPATVRSIIFPDQGSADAETIQSQYVPRLDWEAKLTRTGLANKDLVGQHLTFECPAAPADMRSRRIVGTDRYAFDSMICRAAMHAGKLTLAGGRVTLRMEPGNAELHGSIRNGVETSNGPSGIRSLVFVDPLRSAPTGS